MIDTAIILAIGSKTHQSQLIYNRPRTMLPALGKPLVVRVMDRLHRIGITKYIVVLGEKEGSVANYLNTKWLPDVNIEFVLKRDVQPLGKTLTTIARNFTKSFMIANYNSFTHGNFPDRLLKYHDLSPHDLILTGALNSLSHSVTHTYAHLPLPETSEIGYATTPRSAAEVVAAIGTETSPNHQNMHLTDIVAAGSHFIDYLTNEGHMISACSQFNDIAAAYVQAGHITRLVRTSWSLLVQTDNDLLTLNRHLLEEKIDAHILSEIPYTVHIIEPVRIDPGVSIGQGAIIGPHVYLERGSSIGREARVQNAIVLERASISAREQVRDTIVSTRGRVIMPTT